MKLKPLTPEQIERLTERQAEHIQAPPRTVGGVLVALLVAGVGGLAVGGLLFGILSALGAPAYILLEWSGRGGLLAACLYLALWSFPMGKAQSLRWYAEAQRIVKLSEFHKLEAYREIVALKGQIEELRRALQQTEAERDAARGDVYRIEQEARAEVNLNFVTSEEITPRMIADARQMVQYWFASSPDPDERRSLSRTTAGESPYRWSQPRHRKAQGLLVSAGVLDINGTQPQITVEPMDAALRKLHDYVERRRAAEAAARAAAARVAQGRYASEVEI